MAFENYTDAELARFAQLRALEWFSWPIFLSHTIAPILLAATQSWAVLAAVLVINFFWQAICDRFIHVGLATAGVFIFRLRWPAASASATYLFLHHHYGLAVVALLWPLLATMLSRLSVWLAYACGKQADVFEVQSKFFERITEANSSIDARIIKAAIIVGLVVVSAIALLALGFLADSKQRTSAQVQTEREVPHDAEATKSQTPKTPPSPAASQETASPHLPGQQPTPTPLDLAPVVIEQPKPAPLEPGSQNLPLDASLSKGKATYRIAGVRTDDFLNMRQGPGMNYRVIQRLQNGVDGVTLIDDPVRIGRTTWQKISSRGVVGWVNADYLTSSATARTPEPLAR